MSTPKKKFKYTSGVDISGLVRSSGKASTSTPNVGSPLKQSITPSKSRQKSQAEDGDGGESGNEEEEVQTPSKKVRYADTRLNGPSSRKKEDVTAFLSLLPGSDSTTGVRATVLDSREEVRPTREEMGFFTERTTKSRGVKRKLKPRRDWTYKESVWGSDAGSEGNRKKLDDVGVFGKDSIPQR